MRLLRLTPLFALLAGCLHYEIVVETAVAPDGAIRREISIREKSEEPKTWENLLPPGPPYNLQGDDANGYSGKVTLAPGTHPSGIVYRTDTVGGKVAGAFTIEVVDLGIGKFYRYHETFGTGIEPAKFRHDLPIWIERGLVLSLEALRTVHPDIDWGPVEAHVRKNVVPRVEASVHAIHAALTALVTDHRVHHYDDRLATYLAHPQVAVLQAEMARYGVRRRDDAPAAITLDEYFDSDDWEFPDAALNLVLEPLTPEQRAAVRASILGDEANEAAWEDAFEAAAKKLWPEGAAQEAMQLEAMSALTSLLGAPSVTGFADHHDVRYGIVLPGQLLTTNGELAGDAGVRWQLENDDLLLVEPQLAAHSFLPADGEKPGRWRIRTILTIVDAVRALDEAQMRDFRARLAEGGETEDEEVKSALEAVSDAREEAQR